MSNHPLADDQDKERFIVRRRESLNYLSCDRDVSLTYHVSFVTPGLSGIHFGLIV
jgi:hypothetical protein